MVRKKIDEFRAIKTQLKQIVKEEKIDLFKDLVEKVSLLTFRSYEFARCYLVNNKNNLPLINQEFFRYCITTLQIKSDRGRPLKNIELKRNIDSFFNDHYKPI